MRFVRINALGPLICRTTNEIADSAFSATKCQLRNARRRKCRDLRDAVSFESDSKSGVIRENPIQLFGRLLMSLFLFNLVIIPFKRNEIALSRAYMNASLGLDPRPHIFGAFADRQ